MKKGGGTFLNMVIMKSLSWEYKLQRPEDGEQTGLTWGKHCRL